MERFLDGTLHLFCLSYLSGYSGSEPKDVYRRHDNCSCTVVYESGRGKQNVWSKQNWSQEREYLRKLKDWSDYVVDTSDMLTRQLQEEMSRLFDTDAQEGDMFITIMSFGYKYGIPSDADLVFDVRFLPNPFYVEELKHKTGNDKEVRDYVCQTGEADEFLRRVKELLDYLIPKYKAEGKRQLMVCVGCTGGRHRSVTMANKLADYYEQQPLAACLLHRDIATA